METALSIFLIVFNIIVGLFIGILLFFLSWGMYSKVKDRKAGEKYCEENGMKFLRAVSLTHHTRLYFEKDGIESWVNYETDKKYEISWVKETPSEKIERIKEKTTNPNTSYVK
jgi:hypothetical protein